MGRSAYSFVPGDFDSPQLSEVDFDRAARVAKGGLTRFAIFTAARQTVGAALRMLAVGASGAIGAVVAIVHIVGLTLRVRLITRSVMTTM
jgi:hypothetical protein